MSAEKRGPAQQIPFDLPPPPPRLNRDSFVVGQSNAAAYQTMESWTASTEPALVICGPQASGKSHLASLALSESPNEACIVLDRVERESPERILELVERARLGEHRLILAGRGEPDEWAGGLVDLKTRLAAAPRITTSEPDEALLKAVMAKLFRDRQLRVPQSVIDYAVMRLPKTFAAAQAFVGALDAASIEKGEKPGLKLAREVVANLSEAASTA